jgi:hypothetical protein
MEPENHRFIIFLTCAMIILIWASNGERRAENSRRTAFQGPQAHQELASQGPNEANGLRKF